MDGVNLIKQAFSTNAVKTSASNSKLANTNSSFTDFMGKTSVQNTANPKTNTAQTSGNGYEQYKYTEKNIQASDKTPDQIKMDDVAQSTDDMKDELISTVAEDLNVSEDDLLTAMENLGLVWTDLLNQQNLADVAVELNISGDSTELLLNSDFQNALMDVNQLVTAAAAELGMDADQFTDIVAQMTQVEPEDAAMLGDIIGKALDDVQQKPEDKAVNLVSNVEADAVAETEPDQASEPVELTVDDTAGYNQQETETSEEFSNSDSDDDSAGRDNFGAERNTGEVLVAQDSSTNVLTDLDVDTVNPEPETFVSTDTAELINQVVDNIKLNVSQETTSIEMQLNPENLGKVYVHLSSKEGTVNAQFTATNEVVKEALEAQVVALRENLNQAGVKVDAVEVTVSSHEFERNLEQDQSREEQEGEYQEAAAKQRRRNINMSSLDELEGLMTEEESLVAQMMRDNGNSVDMTV